MNYEWVLFETMWHESGKAKVALEGAREELGSSKPDTGSPGLPGRLRANARFIRVVKTRRSHVSPKAEQQPNAPGLLFCFSFWAEGRFTPISR